MPMSHKPADTREARLQKLSRRLAHARNSELEARLIEQLAIETEAIGRERTHGTVGRATFVTPATAAPSSIRARSRRN
jgi:hypothetical protein